MKVLFLDIDGVLNSEVFMRRRLDSQDNAAWINMLDPEAIERLNHILDTLSEVKVVLSSSWRSAGKDEIQQALEQRGFRGTLIDVTPSLETMDGLIWISPDRGTEIDTWLKGKDVESFVILDDDDDMEPHMDRLVQTSWEFGLTDEHVEKIIELLS